MGVRTFRPALKGDPRSCTLRKTLFRVWSDNLRKAGKTVPKRCWRVHPVHPYIGFVRRNMRCNDDYALQVVYARAELMTDSC